MTSVFITLTYNKIDVYVFKKEISYDVFVNIFV